MTPAPMIVDSDATHTLGIFRRRATFQFAIKNLTYIQKTELSEHQFEHSWEKLRRVLYMIFHREKVELSLQQAYEACDTMCQYCKAEEVYVRLKNELSLHVKKIKEHLLCIQTKEEEAFVASLSQQWLKFSTALILIRNVFIEFDRRYLMQHTCFASLIDFGQKMFKENVMGDEQLCSSAVSEILLLIKQERDGALVDKAMLCNLITMLFDLDLYNQLFEPAFLEDTRIYYKEEASRLLLSRRIPDYLTHVDERVCQETVHRIEDYLKMSTRIPLMRTVRNEMIYEKMDEILRRGFDGMMDRSEKEPLRILYDIVRSTKYVDPLRNAFANYIKERGTEMIRDTKKDSSMIMTIISFKEKIDGFCTDCFSENETFFNSAKENFETFVNSRRSRPAELLAKVMDTKLRTASKSDAHAVESTLDKLLSVFRYLQERDTFEAFYRRYLSKRLLLGRNISEDIERRVLYKLKSECGAGFTKNMESMFKDVEISRDLQALFRVSSEYPSLGNVAFNVNILAQGVWPSYTLCDIYLPSYMVEYQKAFERFYTSKFRGRRLIWQNFLSSCTIKACFAAGTKEINVNLLQTAVLLLFNEFDMLPYAEIVAATGIDDKDLKRVLESLVCGQHKLLLRKGSTGDDDPEISVLDSFTYNSAFTSSSGKVKIIMPQYDQANHERKSTVTKVLIDRQHQLEAAIVRIMKNKKKLSHEMLTKELATQVSFRVEAVDLKKRIESLIEKEYLGRDNDDTSTYVYL
ncbi:cullin 4A [Dichotomocladium elegans]|nr:cullin 4A [Dichotomocladium elegans]